MHAFHKVDLVPVSLRFSYYLVYFSVKYNFDDTAIKSIQQLVTVRAWATVRGPQYFSRMGHIYGLLAFHALQL